MHIYPQYYPFRYYHTIKCILHKKILCGYNEYISGKYKCIILWHLMQRTHRYGELHRLISQATPKMLTQQLRERHGDAVPCRTSPADRGRQDARRWHVRQPYRT